MDKPETDNDEPERWYRARLETDPDDAQTIRLFAIFMQYTRKDLDEAERLYRRAFEVSPTDVKIIGSLARFLSSVRNEYNEAERLYRTGLEFAPDDARLNSGLAFLLERARKDYDSAEHFYQRAIELAPNNSMNQYRFAEFLHHVRKDYTAAESFYRKAVSLRPDDDDLNIQLAEFLHNVRKNLQDAGQFYRAALELDPNNPNTIDDYTSALLENGQVTEAAAIVDRSCELNQQTNSQAGAIAVLYQSLIRRLSQEDDQASLKTLKSRLAVGFTRYSGDLENHLASLTTKLCPQDQTLYQTLGEAIFDEQKVGDLETIERWQQIQSLPPNSPTS
ncbi:cellulose synthase subunit BcsC [Symmachiella dynata]|uniref:tetratricopeptide repeat protein n=1 Tax=Symmachiella dynata TaxID=2527995 RepID=UPI0011896FA5|nr:tetratricopeptide repeat protein [Symmachiella dynata]QDT47584.1 cellulose synthase subunit BcsC [Symmachiella dynata]